MASVLMRAALTAALDDTDNKVALGMIEVGILGRHSEDLRRMDLPDRLRAEIARGNVSHDVTEERTVAPTYVGARVWVVRAVVRARLQVDRIAVSQRVLDLPLPEVQVVLVCVAEPGLTPVALAASREAVRVPGAPTTRAASRYR